MTGSQPTNGLCKDCSLITPVSLCQPDGHQLKPKATDLVASSYQCDMCSLIRKVMDQNTTAKTDQVLLKCLAPRPIVLHGIRALEEDDEESMEEEVSKPLMLIGIEVHIPIQFQNDDDFDIVRLSLYAEDGSEAQTSQDVIGTPLFDDASSPNAIRLVRRWFADCVSNHPACDETASFLGSARGSAAPKLPTRILDIGPSDGSGEVRLYETNAAKAPYAALSHCWGKHRFLTTTSVNIKEHLQEIALAKLPKTFQDAVLITREMGLRYIWIDSLCIVQDDEDDWRKESALMGQVYKDAAITIAASGAEDGREGCFIPRASNHKPVRLPHRTKGNTEEIMHAGLFSDEENGGLDLCPLGQRVWITQEWILSPRIIHYTKGRMIWSCRSAMKSEDGEPMAATDEQRLLESARQYKDYKAQVITNCLQPEQDLDSDLYSDPEAVVENFFSNWCDLISTYTSRSLTYEKDKPIAILGLGQEISTAIGETYTTGILHHSSSPDNTPTDPATTYTKDQYLIYQLFWFPKHELTRPPVLQPSVPSWSWASTIGPVAFHSPARTAKTLVRDLQVCRPQQEQEPATLRATIKITKWDPLAFNLGKLTRIYPTPILDFARPIPSAQWGGDTVFFSSFFSRSTFMTGAAVTTQRATFMVGGDGRRPVGWAGFDLGVVPEGEDVYVGVFSENQVDGVSDGFNVMFLGEQPGLDVDGLGSSRRRFVRLGVGEILDGGFFDGGWVEDVILV